MSTATETPTLDLDRLLAEAGVPKRWGREVIAECGLSRGDEPTDEQRERAAARPDGLKGKALSLYILKGEGIAEQVSAAQQERTATQQAERAERARAAAPRGLREGSALHAAVTVLTASETPLSPQEIYDRAKEQGLAGGLKGKTPVATLGAQLATANKKGLHVERPEPGKYQLRQAEVA